MREREREREGGGERERGGEGGERESGRWERERERETFGLSSFEEGRAAKSVCCFVVMVISNSSGLHKHNTIPNQNNLGTHK
jgi:hypothetical protein